MEHRELSTKMRVSEANRGRGHRAAVPQSEARNEMRAVKVAEILNLSAPYVTALVKKGKLKAHPRQSGGWCGNPGYGYFYQDVMEYQKQRAAGRSMPARQADPALLTELKAALEDFQAARVLLDEQAERLRELAAKLLKEGERSEPRARGHREAVPQARSPQ